MMKKALLLLVAFALTMAASGQRLNVSPRQSGQQVKGKYEFSTTHKSAERGGKLQLAQGRKAPARVNIITEQPEGELKVYQRSGGAMYNMMNYLFTTYQDGGGMKIVFAPDGKTVYMQDPISHAASGAWVRGTLSPNGKTLTVPLNQFIIYYDDMGYGLMTAWVDITVDGNDNIHSTVNPDIHQATFTLHDDGTISLNGSSGDVDTFECSGLGLIYDDDLSWAGYADWESAYTPFDGTPVELPDGIVMEDFSMSYVDEYGNAGGKMVKVGMIDNDVYVQGFSSNVPDGVMKGTFDGDVVIFPDCQYLGLGNAMLLNMMSLSIDSDGTYIENLYGMVFEYDATTRTMTTNEDLGVVAGTGFNVQELYCKPVFAPYTDHAATPANPEVIDFVDYGELGGYNYGSFNVPTVDTEGNFIDPNNLYYRIYFDDDELFRFGPDEYPYVNEYMTDVPYYYTEGYDFGEGGATVYFYETGFQRVGIQSVFRGGGEEHVSEIVYMQLTDGSAPVGHADHYAGYCDDHKRSTDYSAGRRQGYDVAMYVHDPSLKGLKVKGLRITRASATNASHYTGWLSNGLALKLVDGVKVADADIASNVGDLVSGHIEIMFDEPYEIGDNGFFAGYTLAPSYSMYPLMVTSDDMGGGMYVHTTSALRSWTDKSTDGSPCIELILEGQQENAASIILPANSYARIDEPFTVNATVYNHGTAALTAGEYSYEIDDETYTATFTSDIKGDHWGRSSDITFELPAFDEAGTYPLAITLTKVNGTDNKDVAPSSTGNVNIMDFVPVHRVLIEEYTGTWCGWCTRGLVAMKLLAEAYGDDFIGVAYHNSDPMEIMYDFPSPVQGFPSAFVERYHDVDPYYGYDQSGFGMKDLVDYVMTQFAPLDINVNAKWANEAMTEILANVESNFVMNAAGSDYGIEVMLVEDDMYGPAGSNWDQHNYYADMADIYANEPNLGQLCFMSEVIEGYHFNDVLVATSGVVDESLPTSIVANTPNNFRYTFNVDEIYNTSYEPLIQNKDKLHVVAIVVEKATGKVLNAAKAGIREFNAVNELNDNDKIVDSTIYYDLTGRMVTNPTSGIYVKVVRYTDGSQRSFKVLKK
jgi:hypothetical protein